MSDEFWNDLLFKIDDEITRLESLAKPDQTEYTILKKIDADPRNLSLQMELVMHLESKNRLEDSIPVLLNIIAVDRNYDTKKAYQLLMDIFAKLGSANESVKSGRRKLASIMF
jgi:thioredoxin-like negative regulator of GroEL